MTTNPVVTINDEILNELERASTFTNRFMVEVQPYSLRAILSERAELKRDAERYRFIREPETNPRFMASREKAEKYFTEFMLCGDRLDAALDQAMQERQE